MWLTSNEAGIHDDAGSVSCLAVSYAICFRCSSDPSSTVLNQLLAWELTYATGVALKRKKKKKRIGRADLLKQADYYLKNQV